LPQELEKHAIVIDYIQEYDPRRFELILLSIEKSKHRPKLAWIEEEENTVRDILKGCSTIEMEQGLSYAVVSSETKEEFINELLKFKKEILIKAGLIPIDIDECPSLDEVGGMDVLKRYILRSKAILDNHLKIKEMHNLPSPKGILLFGIPGTGKSYISKAIAKTFNWPLVMIEASQIFHRFVGASEQNLKNILTKVEMMSPIVVFIDEIDKLFSGIQSSHLSDAGTTAKVFGIFLTWMQEVKQKVFVVATANSIANLPPELKRKERWDQIFFVDLPDEEEAAEIIRIHLKKYKVNESKINIEELARSAVMKKLTGAEIESAIKEAVADHCVRLLNNEPSELTTKEFHKSILETKGIADDTEIKILKNEAMKIAINASSKKDKSVEQKILKDLQ
jgi:SpoVK/Ycf46/Vps4 family AAA+-type ATPase